MLDLCAAPGCTRPRRTLGRCKTHYERERTSARRRDTAARPSTIDRLPEVLAELLGPQLPVRPACAGRAPEFDEWIPGETSDQRTARLDRARAVCASCPALDACTRVLPDLGHDIGGLWAGQLIITSARPPRA